MNRIEPIGPHGPEVAAVTPLVRRAPDEEREQQRRRERRRPPAEPPVPPHHESEGDHVDVRA